MHRVSRGIALGARMRPGNPAAVWRPELSASVAALHTSHKLNAIEVKMPSLSPTMTEGTIVKWAKAEGDEVNAGDVLCEIQTDKAVVALEADEDGKLAKIVKDKDAGTLKVGQLIAVMAEDGEDLAEAIKEAMASAGDGEASAAPDSAPEAESVSAAPTGGSTEGAEVKMPSLSPTMTEGTIVKWCFKEGDKIGAGDVLCEIQTDKAVVAMEVDDDCVLAKILVPADKPGIQVGSLIALTVEEGEDWADVAIPAAAGAPKAAKAEKKPPPAKAEAKGPTAGEHVFQHVPNVGPAASLLMAQYGIKSGDISGSGPKGIVKSDILSHISKKNLQPIKLEAPKKAAEAKSAPPKSVAKPRSGYTDHPLSSIRSVIAQRLTASKQTSPHGHATAASDIGAVMRLRKELASAGVRVSVNDFVVKAAATALRYVPEMNLNVSGEDFEIMRNIDISVAVATDSGLITPIVTDVPNKTLPEISADIKALAAKAREGKLQLNEFQGGTFTISNLGMFGIDEFTAIINPPQVAILAVGSASQQICPNTGAVRNIMKATLSFDRRFVDEALAADFMSAFQNIMERPEFMDLGMMPIVRKDRAKSADAL